ncbi:MAG: hypothetical protein C0514_05815 [Candidatus Puniceispirillum sp.]|nr:hypothetical protein [Candidatus Puniceispirillum sp.]
MKKHLYGACCLLLAQAAYGSHQQLENDHTFGASLRAAQVRAPITTRSLPAHMYYLNWPPAQETQPAAAPAKSENTYVFPINEAAVAPHAPSHTPYTAPAQRPQEAVIPLLRNYLYPIASYAAPGPCDNAQTVAPPLQYAPRAPILYPAIETPLTTPPPMPSAPVRTPITTPSPHLPIERTLPITQTTSTLPLPVIEEEKSLKRGRINTHGPRTPVRDENKPRKRGRKNVETPHQNQALIQADELFKKGTRFLESKEESDLLEAVKAFRESAQKHPSHEWDGCLGMARACLALNYPHQVIKQLTLISKSAACPSGIKEEALRLSLRMNARLLSPDSRQNSDAGHKK